MELTRAAVKSGPPPAGFVRLLETKWSYPPHRSEIGRSPPHTELDADDDNAFAFILSGCGLLPVGCVAIARMSESEQEQITLSLDNHGPMEAIELATILRALGGLFEFWAAVADPPGYNGRPVLSISRVHEGSMEFDLTVIGPLAASAIRGASLLVRFARDLKSLLALAQKNPERLHRDERESLNALAGSVVRSGVDIKITNLFGRVHAPIVVLSQPVANDVSRTLREISGRDLPVDRYDAPRIRAGRTYLERVEGAQMTWATTGVGERLALIPKVSRVPKPFSLDFSVSGQIFQIRNAPIIVDVDVVREQRKIISYHILSATWPTQRIRG